MPGSLQHHHHRGHFDERQVVGRLLLVPRRHPAVLLDLRPEPLAQVPLPLQVRVDLPLLIPVPLRRDHRRGAPTLDLRDQRASPCRTPCRRSPHPAHGRPAAPRPGRCPTPGRRSGSARPGGRGRRSCRGPWCRSRRGSGPGPARPGRRSRPTIFRAGGAGVRPDGGRVEDQEVEVGVAEGGEDRVPSPGLGPAVEAAPDGVGLAEPLGEVGPGDAGAADVLHGVDEESSVLGASAAVQPGRFRAIRSPMIRSQSASAIACRGSIGGPPWRGGGAAGRPGARYLVSIRLSGMNVARNVARGRRVAGHRRPARTRGGISDAHAGPSRR